MAADPDLDNNVYVYSESGVFDLSDNKVFEVYLENALSTMSEAPRRSEMNTQESSTRALIPNDPDLPIYEEREINGVLCRAKYNSSHTVKQPLLKTLWHQEKPYNIYCPLENGQNTVVGCAAVAIGQICAYHRLPETLDGVVLDWNSMLFFSKHVFSFDRGLSEVADFLHMIGVKVNMKYGLEQSEARVSDALNGFKKLGYTLVKQQLFTAEKCVIALRQNEPIMMFGWSSTGEGHSWVVDGFDNLYSWVEYYRVDNGELYASYGDAHYTYLHFNTGWPDEDDNIYFLCSGNGEYNGYKDFSVFTYSKNNLIITDIRQ